MVRIAIAGGSGSIASEIVDILAATGKHEILILSRKDTSPTENLPSVTWVKAEYSDPKQLAETLKNVHTVLSFIPAHTDLDASVQKALIDAAITAGVKRFAPSEWGSSNFEEMPWYTSKGIIREYLAEINKEKKVLEYSLFQPGALVDYIVPPGSSTTKPLLAMPFRLDFLNRRAIVLEGQDSLFSLTTINDLANIVARAIEFEGEWPVNGGVNGATLPTSRILEIGAEVRGGTPFDITSLKEEDVRAGNILSSWIPMMEAPGVPAEQNEHFSKMVLIGTLLSGVHESWVVSNEWNKLLPDYEFMDVEEFLARHWLWKP
ncbi:hypothetical protein F5884DRAFT_550374 [Xylogone sp. PMI_703]|nr:hypothetical protein F5884DRAFT_550374 [Xylogone sp. PMI_703]